MKKQIVISDIDFVNPEKDSTYLENIIRNLLGNYYFASKNNSYLINPNNGTPNKKSSLINSDEDVSLSSNVQKDSNLEIITLKFNMNEWAKTTFVPNQIDVVQKAINDNLSELYYYGISKNINSLDLPLSPEKIITQTFGKYFYDYSLIIETPLVIPQNISLKYFEGSLDPSVSFGKVEPFYNFLDTDFEKVAQDNPENSLYNFYALYYYLLSQTENQNFLNNNVFPLLKKYDSFLNTYIAQNAGKNDILTKLKEFKKTTAAQNSVDKKVVAILPDSLKSINEITERKTEQPYGIEISFPPQPEKIFNTLIGSLSAAIDLEKVVSSTTLPNNAKKPEELTPTTPKAFPVELFYSNQNNTTDGPNAVYYKIPLFELGEWIKNLEPIDNIKLDNEQTIVISANEKDEESKFLQKIKKVLLQQKVDELVKTKTRTFSEIIAGVPAYNEVVLYEIKKYNFVDGVSTFLQSILIPNTEQLDFYKYFDTQIKYGTQYYYEVIAWTFVIGNEYKYFDRVEYPPQKKTIKQLKNSTFIDSEYFRWFRIADLMTKLQFKEGIDGDDFFSYLEKNEDFFKIENILALTASGIGSSFGINFSRTLTKSYIENSSVNTEYKKVINTDSYLSKANKIISNVSAKLPILLANFLLKKPTAIDAVSYLIAYQTFNPEGSEISTDILGNNNIIDPNQNNYTSETSEVELDILKIFQKAGLFSEVLDLNYINTVLNDYSETGKTAETFKLYQEKISFYLRQNFVVNENLFIDGGFIVEQTDADLTKEPNFGLDINSDYYPRFYIKENSTDKTISGQLQFGVYNKPSIILMGLPYMSSKNTVKVISSPPPPPDVLVIPYKNIANKIKFFLTDSSFTYRDFPKPITSADNALFNDALENEKIKKDDGKITFRGDEPSALYVMYHMKTKPEKFTDFENAKTSIVPVFGGGVEKNIEPNTKNYFMFRSFDYHGMVSNPSAVYEVEMVENSGAIYPIVKVIEVEETNTRSKASSFKEKLRINPNKKHILENTSPSKINSAASLSLDEFGSLTPSLFERKFKIRISSKNSKKKIDINLVFNKTIDLTLVQNTKKT